jgi:isoquinoline 1-oxidoreductase subunit alpha
MISLTVNGAQHELDVAPEMPLLWVLRDELGLTGPKFGCGVAQCGCCTVHVGNQAVRSCSVPVRSVAGQRITTIEALGSPDALHPLQQAWIDEQVPQCGYCQPGQLMAISGLLHKNPHPTSDDLAAAISNICRCGTYDRIRTAVARATSSAANQS